MIQETFLCLGIDKSHINFESFGDRPYAGNLATYENKIVKKLLPKEARSALIRFKFNGSSKSVESSKGESTLDAGVGAGVDIIRWYM